MDYATLTNGRRYYNQPKARIFVPAAAAILLTFGRNGMLPFEDVYTVLDHSMNFFVLITAFVVAPLTLPSILRQNYRRMIPILTLSIWVAACLLVGSPSKYYPSQTALITIGISVLICTQISRFELRRVRYFILLLAAAFSLYVLSFARESLNLIISGSLTTRLGIELSAANVIIFPRIMYMFVITCIATLIIEKNKWLRIGSILLMVIPTLIALATGNRGTLIALFAAASIFILGVKKKLEITAAIFLVLLMLTIGYTMVIEFFPLMENRISTGGSDNSSSERYAFWREALDINNISLFGRGVGRDYPHNIFIEFYLNYGIVGLVLFFAVLATSIVSAWRCYLNTLDKDVLWILSLFTLQMVAQQFSLDIFFGTLWAAIVLPIGLSSDRIHDYSGVRIADGI